MKCSFEPDESFAHHLDAQDPLAGFRDRFYIPEGTIYMDGNSLGLLSKDSEKAVKRVLLEWKKQSIRGWLQANPPWFYLAEKLGALAAKLVGAEVNEVIATGTTTVNIHSMVSTFYKPFGGKKKILSDELNFPSDIYALKGQLKLRSLDPEKDLILCPSKDGRTLDEDRIVSLMTDEIALAFFPSVLYRSGQLLDIPYLTKKAHERQITIGFDCCHSVGAVPHKFDDWQVDFALWCGYKYMNGGPGSTAFIYINKKHFLEEPLISGWFGYVKEKQFDMLLDFEHAKCSGGWQISSPAVLSAAPLEGSLKILLEAGINTIREKSIKLTSYLIYLVDRLLPKNRYRISIGTPRTPERRSGHVALELDKEAWRICESLKARGVIPDFRPPNIIRVAPIALYNTFREVWLLVEYLREIIDNKEYERFPAKRKAIT